ncbi:hypothetical protein [Nonomuraea sp. CA-141351]|uniref:hypothetical protein n=1 Tax=Nonomuraea sp. CA-141351 TaxID=3239996 RepID=UPI003D946C9D
MPNGDDLDARFNELVAQIDEEQQRRMRAAAVKGAKEQRRTDRLERRMKKERRSDLYERSGLYESEAAPRRRVGRAWIAMAVITGLITASGVVVTFRPDLLTPSGAVPDDALPKDAVITAPSAELAGDPAEGGGEEPPGPFAGSPAEDYAEGIAGFVMPEAKALGGLSKKDVAKGLERTRELFGAAFLDRETLMGGKPTAFAELLPPELRADFLGNLKHDDEEGPGYVIRFAPGTAELATDVIKVHGRATLDTFKEDGRHGVKVKLNHLVVYALHRPGRPETTIRLVAHPIGSVLLYRESGRLVVWPDPWNPSTTPASCDTRDAFVHPVYEDSPPETVAPTGLPVDPYQLEEDESTGCTASKGT